MPGAMDGRAMAGTTTMDGVAVGTMMIDEEEVIVSVVVMFWVSVRSGGREDEVIDVDDVVDGMGVDGMLDVVVVIGKVVDGIVCMVADMDPLC